MLHEAAKSGDIDTFINIVNNEQGNINQIYSSSSTNPENNNNKTNNFIIEEGDTPLLVAATHGRLQIVLYLLDQPGINISYQNPHSNDDNALHRASAQNHLSVVQELTKPSIANLPFFDSFLNAAKSSSVSFLTPLAVAIEKRNYGIAKYLLTCRSLSSHVSCLLRGTTTLLHLCLMSAENNTDDNNSKSTLSREESSSTSLPLLVEVFESILNVAGDSPLLASRNLIDTYDRISGLTPLHLAVLKRNVACVRVLVCHGADTGLLTKAESKTANQLLEHISSSSSSSVKDDLKKALEPPHVPFEEMQKQNSNPQIGDIFAMSSSNRAFVKHVAELCDSTFFGNNERSDLLSFVEKKELAIFAESVLNNSINQNDDSSISATTSTILNHGINLLLLKKFSKALLFCNNNNNLDNGNRDSLLPVFLECGKDQVSDALLNEVIQITSLVQMMRTFAVGHGLKELNLFSEVFSSSSSSSFSEYLSVVKKSRAVVANNSPSNNTKTETSESHLHHPHEPSLREDFDFMRASFVSENFIRREVELRSKLCDEESRTRIEIMSSMALQNSKPVSTLKSALKRNNVDTDPQQKSNGDNAAFPRQESLFQEEDEIRSGWQLREKDERLNFAHQFYQATIIIVMNGTKSRKSVGGCEELDEKQVSYENSTIKKSSLLAHTPAKPSNQRSMNNNDEAIENNNNSFQRQQRAKLVGSQLVVENNTNNKKNNGGNVPCNEDLFRGAAISEQALRLQFATLDRNNSGFLEKDEFRFFFCEELEDFGLEISEWEFEQQWWKICGKHEMKLDFTKFALFMLKRVRM